MRVLVDGRPLQGETGRRGVGVYVRGLLGGLAAAGTEVEIVVLADPRAGPVAALLPPGSAVSLAPRSPPGPALVWSRVLGPSWARRASADLVHATFLAPPRTPRGVPLVATVHDLIPLRHPERFGLRQRVVFRRSLAIAARASRVLAVSRDTAARLEETFGTDPGRIDVVPPPVDVAAFAGARRAGPPGVGGPYLLHLGGYDPLKGVTDLLLPAFARVAASRPDLRLVMTGAGPGRDAAERTARALGVGDRVALVGHLEGPAHAEAVAGAAAVVVASWEEGFGLPAVEALAAGVPLAVGPSAATREVAAEHAALATRPTPEGLAAAVEAALAADGPDSAAGERRRRHAARFAPETVARQVVAAYRRALDDARGSAA